MAAQDFELILRVQADLQTAVSQLRTLNDQMRVIKSGAQEASTGLLSLTSAANSVNSQLKSLGGSVNSVGTQIHSLVGAVASLVAIRELAGFVQNVIAADQAVGDMAQKVGVSTEALSALGQVAQRNGSDIDAVQTAFVKLARAATGLDQTGVRALQAMNISLQQFRDLSPEQQFDLVAQKFAGYEDGANKAALATALFGKAGADLIPTLNQVGQQGLQNITDKAIAAGTAVGQGAVDASQKFSNALDTLKEKLQGAVNQGLVQFTPEIDHLTELFNDPRFQQSIADVALGIAEVGEKAIEAAGKIAEFTKNAAEVFAFNQTGAVQSDAGYDAALTRQDTIRAELARRASAAGGSLGSRGNELASSLSTIFNPFSLSPSSNGDALQQASLAFKSDADLKAELATLTTNINRYRAESNKQATGKNPQEGDERGLFVGEGGKTQAPIVPGADAAAKAKQLAEQAAKAQNDLTQALITLQGQLDPTAAAYAAYNATVKQATDNAELAKKAKGADAQAIDAQRDAIIQLAASVRDAALDKIAEQDRQAWEALKRSIETPAEVRVDDALKQIQQLNELMKDGTHSAAEYHQMLVQIGQKSVAGALPQYKGLGSSVGGDYGELQKNYQAQTALEAAYQAQKLALDQKFNDQDEAQHAAHLAALATLDKNYKDESAKIDQARGQLQLQAASTLFGQLATLSSSHNKKIAAIGKAAAIAQTIINTYQSATEAYAAMASIPYIGPALGIAAAAAAIAAGLANVAQIRSQDVTAGYAGGGAIHGPGTETSDSVPILASNGEYMHNAAAVRYYGVPFMDAINQRMFPRFADGGLIASNPLANAPSPTQLGFAVPRGLNVGSIVGNAANDANGNEAGKPPDVHVYAVFDPAELADKVMNTGPGHKVIVDVAGNNPRAIQAKWGR